MEIFKVLALILVQTLSDVDKQIFTDRLEIRD